MEQAKLVTMSVAWHTGPDRQSNNGCALDIWRSNPGQSTAIFLFRINLNGSDAVPNSYPYRDSISWR